MVEPGTHGQDVTHGGRSDTPDTTPDEVPFLRVQPLKTPRTLTANRMSAQ